jgi:hypothetical protein
MTADIAAFFGPCAPITVIRQTVALWETGPGFTGWHQIAFRDVSNGQGSGNLLPPQDAMCVQYRTDGVPLEPAGRQRNRMYLGPLRTAALGTDGRLTDAVRDDWAAGFATLIADIAAAEASTVDPDLSGLCVVSPTAGLMWPSNVLVIDRAVDTQRRRREKVPGDREFYVV